MYDGEEGKQRPGGAQLGCKYANSLEKILHSDLMLKRYLSNRMFSYPDFCNRVTFKLALARQAVEKTTALKDK